MPQLFYTSYLQALCKPVKDVLGARLDRIVDEHENRDFITAALKYLGLSSHHILSSDTGLTVPNYAPNFHIALG